MNAEFSIIINFTIVSCSSDLDQREKEKSKLEKSFKESDKKLDVLVTGKNKYKNSF